jgi:hypothetical protein
VVPVTHLNKNSEILFQFLYPIIPAARLQIRYIQHNKRTLQTLF